MELNKIYLGDNIEVLKSFPDNSINCCITSPPYYGLRDYGTGKWVGGDPNCQHKRISKYSENTITGHAQEELRGNVGDAIYKTVCPICGAVREDKQVGLEETPEEYIDRLVNIFREVKRVLKDDGTLWVNIGDTYYGSGGGRGSTYHDGREDVVQAGNKGFNDMLYAPVLTKKHEDLKPKDMIGIPWMLAFALRKDGWYLRQDIIWHKPNPMPESVKDRCTKSHEYIFLLSKSPKYYFDYQSIQEPAKYSDDKRATQGRIAYDGKRTDGEDDKAQQSFVSFSKKSLPTQHKNLEYNGQPNHTMHERRAEGLPDEEYVVRNKRDVWSIKPSHFKGAHFATFPEDLVLPMLLAGCPEDGVVLDPFMGSGTVGVVARKSGRNYVGIDLNQEYIDIAEKRLAEETGEETKEYILNTFKEMVADNNKNNGGRQYASSWFNNINTENK